MRIEKKYFTTHQQWLDYHCQNPQEFKSLPQTYDPADEIRIQALVDKAMEIYEQNKKRITYEVVNDRNVRFFDMADKIVPVAQWFPMDLLIEAHKTDMGIIQLRKDYIIIDEKCPLEIRSAFLEVLSAADEIQISCTNSLAEIKLYFQRFEVVREA